MLSNSSFFPLQSLFELELAGCNEVTEAGLWSCLTPRIVSLSLADCINIADEAVGAVAQLLPSLYEFSLQVSYYHVFPFTFRQGHAKAYTVRDRRQNFPAVGILTTYQND